MADTESDPVRQNRRINESTDYSISARSNTAWSKPQPSPQLLSVLESRQIRVQYFRPYFYQFRTDTVLCSPVQQSTFFSQNSSKFTGCLAAAAIAKHHLIRMSRAALAPAAAAQLASDTHDHLRADGHLDINHYFVGVTGNTGVGKSSLINALLGLDQVRSTGYRITNHFSH